MVPNGAVGCRLRSMRVPAHAVYRPIETSHLTRRDAFTRLRSWVRVPQRPLLFVQVRSSEGKDLGIRVRFSVRPLSVRDPSKGADRGGWPCCNRGNNERAESLGDRVIGFG